MAIAGSLILSSSAFAGDKCLEFNGNYRDEAGSTHIELLKLKGKGYVFSLYENTSGGEKNPLGTYILDGKARETDAGSGTKSAGMCAKGVIEVKMIRTSDGAVVNQGTIRLTAEGAEFSDSSSKEKRSAVREPASKK